MKVYRTVMKKNPDRFEVGDVIKLGKYTATCQLVDDLAIFMLDQYLDKPYDHEADMLIRLNEDLKNDNNFKKIRKHLVKWDDVYTDGLYFRLPYLGEMFDVDKDNLKEYFEPDCDNSWCTQWQLMKNRKNRIAIREGEEYEWGWLMNKYKNSAAYFADVTARGYANGTSASNTYIGVRPVFCVEATCRRDYKSYKFRDAVNNAHWIDNHNGTISCSHCHTWFNKDDRYSYMRFCPYCNVRMAESGDKG